MRKELTELKTSVKNQKQPGQTQSSSHARNASMIARLTKDLNAENLDAATALATYPQLIRGFGHVKEGNVEKAKAERMRLRAGFKNVGGFDAFEAAPPPLT